MLPSAVSTHSKAGVLAARGPAPVLIVVCVHPTSATAATPAAPMLEISNLHARLADGREILQGIDLLVNSGEVHAIMGPNGSGKSTLAAVLAGREGYEVSAGTVTYLGRDLLTMPAEERAREGLFLAFQYPVEIPGVNNMYFLRAAMNAQRRHRGERDQAVAHPDGDETGQVLGKIGRAHV